jgi:enoyl-CoA hydratase/carnithine racemase
MSEARKLAAQIATSAPLAVYASRQVVLAAAYQPDDELKKLTNTLFAQVMSSEDTKEGLTAFIEKRTPNWTGK